MPAIALPLTPSEPIDTHLSAFDLQPASATILIVDGSEIDLIILDLVLPEMDGPEQHRTNRDVGFPHQYANRRKPDAIG